MRSTDIHKAYPKVKELLKKIPNVVTVGIGLKEVKGKLTDQVVYRVYVKEKKPLLEIEPENVIPKEIRGYKTDVLTYFKMMPLSIGGIRPLIGGISISRALHANGLISEGIGTLGCIGKLRDQNKYVMLSNEHVFDHTVKLYSPNKVYQPKYSQCCGFICNEVGETIKGKLAKVSYNYNNSTEDFFVDCAIASINEEVGASNSIAEIGLVAGYRDVLTMDRLMHVKKMGAKTGLTNGIISEIEREDDNVGGKVFFINASTGKPWSGQYKVPAHLKDETMNIFRTGVPSVTVTDLGNNVLKFETTLFSDKGDSGSVIMNESNEIVGLLYKSLFKDIVVDRVGPSIEGIPTGIAVACYIGPVLQEMNIEIPTGTIPSSGNAQLAAGTAIWTEYSDDEADINTAFRNLEEELLAMHNGKLFAEAIERHIQEIVDLVNHRRRVKVAWHRYKGPAFANILINAVRDSKNSIRKEINGVELQSFLNKMRDMLLKEGSQELKGFIEKYTGFVHRLSECDNVDEMKHYIKNASLIK